MLNWKKARAVTIAAAVILTAAVTVGCAVNRAEDTPDITSAPPVTESPITSDTPDVSETPDATDLPATEPLPITPPSESVEIIYPPEVDMTDPTAVATYFLRSVLNIPDGELVPAAGDETMRASVRLDEETGIIVDLYQPGERGKNGEWAVERWFRTDDLKSHPVRDYETMKPLFHNESVIPEGYKAALSQSIEELLGSRYDWAYDILGYESGGVRFTEKDGAVEVTFFLTMVHKNHYQDPDTVGYIKEAKERESYSEYATLYEDFLATKFVGFSPKITARVLPDGTVDADSIEIFFDVSVTGAALYKTAAEFFG